MKKKISQEDLQKEAQNPPGVEPPEDTSTSPKRPAISLPSMVAPPGASAEAYVAAGTGDVELSREKKKRSKKAFWITLSCVIALLLAAYLGFAVYFMDRFAFNTSINGINCALLTPEEVDEKIHAKIANYTLKVDARENKSETISSSAINLIYTPNGYTQTLLAEQNSFLWPLYLVFPPAGGHASANISFDEDKITSVVSNLPFMNPEQMAPPKDAYLEFVPPSYQIHAEEQGTTLDATVTNTVIADAVRALAPSVNLDKANCYLKPEVYADSSALAEWRGVYNKYVAFSITYTIGDVTEVIDGKTAINWVTIGETTPGDLNYDAVVAWVNGFADRHDTLGKDRTIVNGYGEEKTVPGNGNYGWQVDRNAEVEAILAACRARTAEVREPHFSVRGGTLGQSDWGTTYAEVDISAQHMWYFENGQLVMESDVVTGLNNGSYNTPPGVYRLMNKQSPSILIGQIMPATGEPEYRTPVSFWMPFTGQGHGFHDATWQPSFGGDRWRYAGSHGCVNMPYETAQQLYSLINVGCPVVIHY